jgi:hypothetical protein
MQDFIKDRGTHEIPEEILKMSQFYPYPENYTYKVRKINGKKTISIFPILTIEKRNNRQMDLVKAFADIIEKYPEQFSNDIVQ